MPIDSVTDLDGEYVRIDAADHTYRVLPAGDAVWVVDTDRVATTAERGIGRYVRQVAP